MIFVAKYIIMILHQKKATTSRATREYTICAAMPKRTGAMVQNRLRPTRVPTTKPHSMSETISLSNSLERPPIAEYVIATKLRRNPKITKKMAEKKKLQRRLKKNESISLGGGDNIFAPHGNDQNSPSQGGRISKETHKQSQEPPRELEAGKDLSFESVVFFFGITGGDQKFATIRGGVKRHSLEDFVARRHDSEQNACVVGFF